MAAIDTFKKAVEKFNKYYSTWHAHREFWPTNVDLSLFGCSDADKASVLRLIEKLQRILTDNALADALDDCGKFSTTTLIVDTHKVKPESRALLVSELARRSLFTNWKKDEISLTCLCAHFCGLTRENNRNKPYWVFYASCSHICKILHKHFFN